MLPPSLLGSVLQACRETFDIMPDAEITSEANPGTVDQPHFAALRELGVNRLSMGVQSFDDSELGWLGRIHSAAEAENAFTEARHAGFTNINLDFMFGLPGQAAATWEQSLSRALALGPEHLSLYSLTVERGTPLADWVRQGRVAEPDDDLAADLYLAATETLAARGYVQYEISNWAKDSSGALASSAQPSAACRHNLVYWHDEGYLGFGAGAHSYAGGHRRWNVRPVPHYIRRIEQGQASTGGEETIEPSLAMGEIMMLGLRLVREGVSEDRFRARSGNSLDAVFAGEIVELVGRGLLERLPERVRLTTQGRLLGNQVFAMFLPDY